MSFVRGAVRGDARKAFNADVRALCAAHHDKRAFELPLQTKLYVLEKASSEGRWGVWVGGVRVWWSGSLAAARQAV